MLSKKGTSRKIRELGQHFLISKPVAIRLIDLANVKNNDIVLEIGTGRGILTELLAERAKEVWSYEVDKEIAKLAQKTFSGRSNVSIINGDAFDPKQHVPAFDVCVTSLPYSRSTDFVKWIVLRSGSFRQATCIVQAEFANKLNAFPGENNYRAVSVLAQMAFRIESLERLGKENFSPRPRVESKIIRFTPRQDVKHPVFTRSKLHLLNKIFSFRRKLFSSALRKLNLRSEEIELPKDILNSRVENLTISQFETIIGKVQL